MAGFDYVFFAESGLVWLVSAPEYFGGDEVGVAGPAEFGEGGALSVLLVAWMEIPKRVTMFGCLKPERIAASR